MTQERNCDTCCYFTAPTSGLTFEDANEQCWTCRDPRHGGVSHWAPIKRLIHNPVPPGALVPLDGGLKVPIPRLTTAEVLDRYARATRPPATDKEASDGSSADYYKLPSGAANLQDLISHRNMNAQIGEIFRACYRYGKVSHSPEIRDIKKIIFYAKAELKRLESLS